MNGDITHPKAVPDQRPTVAIVGCGAVGTSLGVWLSRCGYPIAAVASRNRATREAAARLMGASLATADPWTAAAEADLVLITVSDDAIADVAEVIGQQKGFRPGQCIYHSSGALASDILSAASNAGAHVASIHPLQSFARPSVENNPFTGVVMAIEGDPPATRAATAMAEALGARPLAISTQGKACYHAAAVMASNYLVSLMDLALGLMEAAGVAADDALPVLQPLVDGTLANIRALGPTQALTGPIVRGDADTVQRHLSALAEARPKALAAYKALGHQALALAEARGTLSFDQKTRLATLLAEPG